MMSQLCATAGLLPDHLSADAAPGGGGRLMTYCTCMQQGRPQAVPEACSAWCRVELRTQEAERGMNSEEAEKLVWAAQTIFATGCKLRVLSLQLL